MAPTRFLVVDDSPDMRFLVVRVLRRIEPQARVEAARDGEEALARLRNAGEGDGLVVITDYDMGPGATGVELLAKIKVLHPRARRVLFTGHDPERIERAASEPHAIISKAGGTDRLCEFLRAERR